MAEGGLQKEPQSVLVTGGAGFIGTHTVLQLLKEGFRVSIIDNLDNSVEEAVDRVREIAGAELSRNLTFHLGDLRNKEDLEKIFSQTRFDAVIHFAGLKAVGESVAKPMLYYNNNLVGTLNLYEFMRKYGCKKMVFSSSATVYGQPEKIPCVEDFQLKAMNPYGRTKLFLEEIARDVQKADQEWRIILLSGNWILEPVAMSSSFLPATTDSIAQALEAKDPSESISILYRVLENPSSSPEALRIKEQAISNLSDLLRQEKRAEDLRSLLTQLRPFFSVIPKAKTAKIVRGIIDAVAKIPSTSDLQISLCKEMVEWTRAEKRTFLRQRVEARLAALLMENHEYAEALTLLSGIIKEVRRLDDKLLLVDINLLESKLHFSLRNLPKAKAALTAARTAANAIYVPPVQQGTIDLQSGILHAEEKDYKTAYSYFFEAFEAFNSLEDPRAVFSLKYMLLCKIMVSQSDDVAGIISSRAGLLYLGPDMDAMKAVADAHSKRSLRLFEIALRDYKPQLEEDPIVHRHLSSLYDTLLEQNLCRLIEPFSKVDISHIAELIELPVDHVEKKLSQMILDKKFAGTLDQGAGCLVVFEDAKPDAIFQATLEIIADVGKVVDSLYVRSARIMA